MRGIHKQPPPKTNLEYYGLWLTGLVMCFASLTGCSNQEPIVKVETKEVQVPVAVGCLNKSDIPEPVSESYNFKKNDPLGTKVQGLLIERNERIILENKLFAIINGCTIK